jgi:hypothetical protein
LNITTGSAILQNFLPKEIDIKKLIIWSDGRFEIEGGCLVLTEPIR